MKTYRIDAPTEGFHVVVAASSIAAARFLGQQLLEAKTGARLGVQVTATATPELNGMLLPKAERGKNATTDRLAYLVHEVPAEDS